MRRDDAEHLAARYQHQDFTQDHPDNVSTMGPERHPDTDFACASDDGVRHGSVESDAGDHRCQDREAAAQLVGRHRPEGVSQILAELLQNRPSPRGARVLAHLREIAQLGPFSLLGQLPGCRDPAFPLSRPGDTMPFSRRRATHTMIPIMSDAHVTYVRDDVRRRVTVTIADPARLEDLAWSVRSRAVGQ